VGVGNVGELKIRLRERLGNEEQWPELAEQVLGMLQGLTGRTVLVLDEFPIMVGNMLNDGTEVGLRFLRWFRTFRQSSGTGNLAFLLGGSTNIEPRLESLRSEALLGDLQRYRIQPFDREQALAFVEAVLEEEHVAYEC